MALRSNFDKGLDALESIVLEQFEATKVAYKHCINAYKDKDEDLANKIICNDYLINQLEEKVNEESILLIAKESPVAVDLRRIMTAIKISNDVERIADYAVNISKNVIFEEYRSVSNTDDLLNMLDYFMDMLEGIRKAFIDKDSVLAKQIAFKDKELNLVYKSLMEKLMNKSADKTSQSAISAVQTLLLVKQVERAGDHIKNIAENIIFQIKGKRYDL